MEKDIQRLTENERYDLKRKQLEEEYKADMISTIENTLGILSTRQTIEDLKAENQRLKNELDKQIKDNRKLVKALKEYANTEPYVLKEDDWGKQCLDIRKIAKEVLKEVEEV